MNNFLFMLLLSPLAGFSQKIASDKIDDFDKTRTISTTETSIAKGKYYSNNLSTKGAKFFIQSNSLKDTSVCLYLFFRARDVMSIDENSKIVLKFEDGQLLEGRHGGSYKIYTTGNSAAAYLSFSSNGTPVEDLLKASISKVIKIRIGTSVGDYDFDIPEKNQMVIANTLKLLLESK